MDEIEAGDEFGDGVFDLEARVHFQEVEVFGAGGWAAGFEAFDEELDGAGVDVAGAEGEADGGFAHAAAEVRADDGRWGFLDDLLVAALYGALALAEVDAVAVGVGEELDFDVAGALDEFFEVDFAGAEAAFGFAAGGGEGGFHLGCGGDGAHAFAAAAGRGLEHDGVADLGSDADGFGDGGEAGDAAGDSGHGGCVGGLAGAGLGAEGAHGGGGRADEDDAGALAGFGEGGVFGEEAVAGVDGVGACAAGDVEDEVAAEVALGGGRGAEPVGLVGHQDVERGAVGVGVDSNGGDAELAAGAEDSEGDLAAVGDQNFLYAPSQGAILTQGLDMGQQERRRPPVWEAFSIR